MEWKIKQDFKDKLRYATIAWLEDWLARFDTSELAYINMRLPVKAQSTKGGHGGVYGMCYYPARKKRDRVGIKAYYRISCTVAQKIIPFQIDTRRKPLYKNPDGTWPPVPEGCKKGAWNSANNNGKVREWWSIIGQTNINTFDEAAVWLFGHEIFHFLRRTKQVPGRNTQIEADVFGDALLYCFRIDRKVDNFGLPVRSQ